MRPNDHLNYKTVAAQTYAQAVYDVAKQNFSFDQWQQTLKNLSDLVKSPQFRNMVNSPAVDHDDIKDLMMGLLDKADATDYERHFVSMLIEDRNLMLVPGIYDHYVDIRQKATGPTKVTVTTTEPMGPQTTLTMKDWLKERFNIRADISNKVDPSIISGIVISFNGKTIDQSAKGYLAKKAAKRG